MYFFHSFGEFFKKGTCEYVGILFLINSFSFLSYPGWEFWDGDIIPHFASKYKFESQQVVFSGLSATQARGDVGMRFNLVCKNTFYLMLLVPSVEIPVRVSLIDSVEA